MGDIMIIEGLKLTLIGMSVVYFFLILMIFIIVVAARFCSSSTRKECEAMGMEVLDSELPADDSFHLMAVISAAINKHRNK